MEQHEFRTPEWLTQGMMGRRTLTAKGEPSLKTFGTPSTTAAGLLSCGIQVRKVQQPAKDVLRVGYDIVHAFAPHKKQEITPLQNICDLSFPRLSSSTAAQRSVEGASISLAIQQSFTPLLSSSTPAQRSVEGASISHAIQQSFTPLLTSSTPAQRSVEGVSFSRAIQQSFAPLLTSRTVTEKCET